MTKKTTKRPAKKRATVEGAVTVEQFNLTIKGLHALLDELNKLKARVGDLERAELFRRAGPTVSDNFSRQIPVN